MTAPDRDAIREALLNATEHHGYVLSPGQAAALVPFVARMMEDYAAGRVREAYRDGESNRDADYAAAFDEWPDLSLMPDVAAFAAKVTREALTAAAEAIEAADPFGSLFGNKAARIVRNRAGGACGNRDGLTGLPCVKARGHDGIHAILPEGGAS